MTDAQYILERFQIKVVKTVENGHNTSFVLDDQGRLWLVHSTPGSTNYTFLGRGSKSRIEEIVANLKAVRAAEPLVEEEA